MTNCKPTSHYFDISLCFNSLTKENADNKWADEQWFYDEHKTQVHNAPMLTVISKVPLEVDLDIYMS